MLAPANYYFLHQELCLFVCRPVTKLHSAPFNSCSFRLKKCIRNPSPSYSAVGWTGQFHCLQAAGILSVQASCFSAWCSNNRSAALCTATATDGQSEQPGSGQHSGPGQQQPLCCSLTNHCWFWDFIMVTQWTTDSWEAFGRLPACTEKEISVLLTSVMNLLTTVAFKNWLQQAIENLCCGIFLWYSNMQSRFLLDRIHK